MNWRFWRRRDWVTTGMARDRVVKTLPERGIGRIVREHEEVDLNSGETRWVQHGSPSIRYGNFYDGDTWKAVYHANPPRLTR